MAVFVKILTLMVFLPILAFGQKPSPSSIDKETGATGELVTLKGNSFGSDATKLSVHFGAAKGVIESVTDQLLEVRVPFGTTYDNISVTNTTSGLSGFTSGQFLLSFGGKHPFDVTNLEGQKDFPTESALYDLCLCDFDGDNKVDVGTTTNNNIVILPNTTTAPGLSNITFGKNSIPVALKGLQIKCGDLNGDGKPDIVATDDGSNSDKLIILRNTSAGTISFAGPQILSLPGRSTKTVEISDLDLDGKPELIVTDQSSNIISVLQNTSSLAAVSFSATPLNIAITGAATTDGLAVEDLNGDHLPEIIASQFQTNNSKIFIVENKSISGSFSLSNIITLPVSVAVKNIRVGDLDGDRKPDIAFTQLISSSIGIVRNTSTNSSISFAAVTNVTTESAPWGLDFGDLDGDGKPDIVVTSVQQTRLTILNNESTPGNFAFIRQTKNTAIISGPNVTRHVGIGDLDSDGKPDIAFTSIDDATLGPASLVSIFRNKTCLIPEIQPSTTPLRLCDSALPYRLFASVSRGAFYEWKKDGTTLACGVNMNTFDVTAVTGSGNYTVVIHAEGGNCASDPAGACAEESSAIEVLIGVGSAGDPMPTNNGPVCVGSELKLSLTDIGATEYRWTGPEGYSGTGINPPSIPNFTLANAGRYFVDVIIGTCIARQESTLVEAIDVPNVQVGFSGSPVICQGDPAKTLTIVPVPAGFSFQWKKNGVAIGGATGSSYSVTSVPASTGDYSVEATFAGCTNIETPAVTITVASPPTASFTIPASACAGQQVQFTNQSTIPNTSLAVSYAWTFGDGNTSSEENPVHIYVNAGSFNPKLNVSYSNGACADEEVKPITITPAPAASITNPDNQYIFCPGDSLKLEVIGSFTSYTWNTGATTSSIIVKEAGTYTVDLGTTVGCVLTAIREVDTFEEPLVIVTADPQLINEGETSLLSASGLQSYTWEPSETLSDPSIPNPIASPIQTTQYTVSGEGENGCPGKASITLEVKGEAVVNKLKPKNFFSPNDDATNPFWLVGEIENYPQCNVAVYDDKGIKVFEAKPYDNNWDGTYKGKRLPDGVYYFVIRCDGEEATPRVGSITLLR